MRRITSLSWRHVGLFAQALVALLLVRWHLDRRRGHRLRQLVECNRARDRAPDHVLSETAWAVAAISRHFPKATCLTQATVGQWLLARQGYATTIRISVPRGPSAAADPRPHAWLMSGDTIVLGGTPAQYHSHVMLHDYPLPASGSAR
ncbi:lasso peptide biosynthesis B2 protein [Paracoccus ravus]|uniref:lasso peptide biosynthesis B2 protein n=1 Tax=Paracoccus ravus TaxID=2447760 RepID=UPI0014304875|nr:lasso peptide biosynthesis B2 protein [Paracoccus ravus]